MKDIHPNDPCPCGSGGVYSFCCGVAHQDRRVVSSPEQLMRSRYCAFALKRVDYLRETHRPPQHTPRHQKTRGRRNASVRATDLHWVALEIISTEMVNNDEGYVEFKAFYEEGHRGERKYLHERSRFLRLPDQGTPCWFYIDGVFLSSTEGS